MSKKRRRQSGSEGEGALLKYSESSASVQSRRRAQLVQHIRELAGGGDEESAHLLRDVLNMPGMRAVGADLAEGTALRTVMENIRLMHDAVPAERRTAVLALAAPAFTGPELRDKWGISFGTHQLQDARRIARDHAFHVEPRARHVPASRRPKDDAFVQRLHELLDARSEVDARGERVVTQSLRSLHRDFVALDERNRISFSAFRQLALGHVRLGADADEVPDFGSLDLASQLALPQLLLPPMESMPPMQPMPFGDLLLSQPPTHSAYDIPTIQSFFDLAGTMPPTSDPADPSTLPAEFFYL
ncbi:hypothetical protein IW148_003642 [Coemansia sp. RSA 1199]|nr:hypothetical protein IW148_003642 [Coemansia sp. RSA 1199]